MTEELKALSLGPNAQEIEQLNGKTKPHRMTLQESIEVFGQEAVSQTAILFFDKDPHKS